MAKFNSKSFSQFTNLNVLDELRVQGVLSQQSALNEIVINQESDFPDQDTTTITLATGTAYKIGSPFVTTKTIIGNNSTVFSSSAGGVPLITYTGTGSMFKVDNTILRVTGMTVDCPNGTAFEINGDNTGNPNQRMNIANLAVVNCEKFIDFNGAGAVVLGVVQMGNLNGSIGAEFNATNALVISLDRVACFGLNAGAVMWDFGTMTALEIEMSDVIVAGDAAAIAMSGAANSANILSGGNGTVTGCNFATSTTPLSGIDEQDIRWNFTDNSQNVENSNNSSDTFLMSPETVTINTIGVFEPINGVNWSSTVQNRFTTATSGVTTYIGERPIKIKTSGSVTMEKVGGGSDQIEARIALNGTTLLQSSAITENSAPTSVPLESIFDVVNGDEISVEVANNTSTADVIVDAAIFVITGF